MDSPLIHEETEPSQEHTPPGLQPILLEQTQDLPSALSSLDGDGGADGLDLTDDIRVICREVVHGAKHFDGFLFAAALGEPVAGLALVAKCLLLCVKLPSRRFRDAKDDDGDRDGEDQLKPYRSAPVGLAGNKGEAIIDPLYRAISFRLMGKARRYSRKPVRYQCR